MLFNYVGVSYLQFALLEFFLNFLELFLHRLRLLFDGLEVEFFPISTLFGCDFVLRPSLGKLVAAFLLGVGRLGNSWEGGGKVGRLARSICRLSVAFDHGEGKFREVGRLGVEEGLRVGQVPVEEVHDIEGILLSVHHKSSILLVVSSIAINLKNRSPLPIRVDSKAINFKH